MQLPCTIIVQILNYSVLHVPTYDSHPRFHVSSITCNYAIIRYFLTNQLTVFAHYNRLYIKHTYCKQLCAGESEGLACFGAFTTASVMPLPLIGIYIAYVLQLE